MTSDEVLAVVVSYNGKTRIRETVSALRGQVGHIHIVDNGSESGSLAVLDDLECQGAVSVERLGQNRGIGYALNRGVERARALGCRWLLTMDQDSVVDASLMAAYGAAIAEHPGLVSLSPHIAGSGAEIDAPIRRIGSAITSGNLVKLSMFEEVGLYDESFFIDSVDFDFCLRLRRAGYSIHRVPAAIMHHQLGEVQEVPSFLKRLYAEHSPLRRYYMSRNFMYMTERYLLRFPLFVCKLAIAHLVLLVLVGIYDPKPIRSFSAVLRGVWDYLARRDGPYVERVP